MKKITRYTVFHRILPRTLWSIIRAVIIGGLCYVILYPYFAKIVNSFKSYSDFIDPSVRFIPKAPTLDNIRLVMERLDYWSTLLNTLLLALSIALITTFISAFIAYGFARFNFKGKSIMFFVVILTLIVPPQTMIIPLYLQFQFFAGFLNLLNTPYPMIILALTGLSLKNGLYIFMLRQNFRNMPKELEEAAYLDGCGVMSTYFRIILPSARTMLVTIFLLAFCWQWTDMVYNPLFLREAQIFSNIVSLAGSATEPIMSASMISTAALLAILPLVVLYIFTQKLFVQSVERTGITG